MKKWMKIIGALFLIGMLAAVYVWFFVYNKPHRDFANAAPDHILSAEELFFQYRHDKSLSDSLYTGMVVQITGPLADVESADSLMVAVFVFDQGMFGDEGVRCIMLPDQFKEMKEKDPGGVITLKGYCTGYNDTDVIIEKASVVKLK